MQKQWLGAGKSNVHVLEMLYLLTLQRNEIPFNMIPKEIQGNTQRNFRL